MQHDRLSATFSALADPTRRAILARLSMGETSVSELAEPFEMSRPAISKHLKVLESAGLIARGRQAQWRPCRLEASPLKDIHDWVDEYRRFWEQSFDRLEDYLQELQAQEIESKNADNKDIGNAAGNKNAAGAATQRGKAKASGKIKRKTAGKQGGRKK